LAVIRRCVLAAAVLSLVPQAAPAAEIVRVGGTGMGLALARAAGDRVEALHPGTRTEVLPSLGTPGGIRALVAGAIDVAIATRAPTPDEQAKGVQSAFCLKTALVFATSHANPAGIRLAQLPQIFSDADPRWPDGTPLKVILRSRAGTENPYLVKLMPAMEAAFDAAYKRPGMPISATDQENAEIARRTAGSFAIMTLLQLRSENLALKPLTLDGIAPNAQTVAEGSYPMPLPVCLLVSPSPAPATARFIAFIRSPEGLDLVRSYGANPSD